MFADSTSRRDEIIMWRYRQDQTICVLDMSGFENFDRNSFEQFCINIANEYIQQYFKKHLMDKEQELYLDEGIRWKNIDCDNDGQLLKLCFQVSSLWSLSQ